MLEPIRQLLDYLRNHRRDFVLAFICMLFVSLTQGAIILIVRDLTNSIIVNEDLVTLNLIALGILVIALARGVFTYGKNYLVARIGQGLVRDLRERVYTHLQNLSLSFFERRRTGDILSRLTNDMAVLQNVAIRGMIRAVTSSLELLVSVGIMFYIHWRLSLLTMIVAPIFAWAVRVFNRKMRRANRRIQSQVSDLTTLIQEALSGIRLIKAFGQEEREIDRFQEENEANFRAGMRGARYEATLAPVVEVLGIVGLTVVFWYGGFEAIRGNLRPGDLVAFLVAVTSVTAPLKNLSGVTNRYQQVRAAAERIFELLGEECNVREAPDAVALPRIEGRVEFDGVHFTYDGREKVLEDISFVTEPGQVAALVGASGAGKSTLVDLLPRFYDPSRGRITIDGHDLRKVRLDSLRDQMGIVAQETFLFASTVAENIAYGVREAGREEIELAARAANAHHFITELPRGYETQVGERGVTLSGGQRQRVAIARALLKNPRILILDEATSSLDSESEALVQEALERLMEDRTTFVIAHRLSTVINADQILVLEDGRIKESGTHSELISRGGPYSSLYRGQFRRAAGEEAAAGDEEMAGVI